MLVKERMTRPVITVYPDTLVPEAIRMMREENVRRFPVVDRRGKLMGIVSERDLLHAQPSDATTLSIWEINYLLGKITVSKVMTRRVIAIREDTPIQEAARIMADHKIGGLPVLREGQVVGIITETDLFKIFLELLGARASLGCASTRWCPTNRACWPRSQRRFTSRGAISSPWELSWAKAAKTARSPSRSKGSIKRPWSKRWSRWSNASRMCAKALLRRPSSLATGRSEPAKWSSRKTQRLGLNVQPEPLRCSPAVFLQAHATDAGVATGSKL